MVVLIAGASHSGKTLLAQRLVEKTHYPCLSLDLLKMGLIRSGQTTLTPQDDEALTACLWPIAREMVKTALENRQNLIVEGCYIPFTWQDSFPPPYRQGIRWRCLVLSAAFIRQNFAAMQAHASDIEHRQEDSGFTMGQALKDNAAWLAGCQAHNLPYTLIDGAYQVPLDL